MTKINNCEVLKKKKKFKLLLLNKLFYIWMGHDGQGVGR